MGLKGESATVMLTSNTNTNFNLDDSTSVQLPANVPRRSETADAMGHCHPRLAQGQEVSKAQIPNVNQTLNSRTHA